MTIVRTTTPAGEAIVILPEAEFDRLRELAEDALDQRALEFSQARIAAGDEDLLSEADLDALNAAPSALSFWRVRRRRDRAVLARDAAIDEATLTALERGEATGERSLYERLARLLDVDVEDILPGTGAS